jgi:hypothetical protein
MVRVEPRKHLILRSVEFSARNSPVFVGVRIHHAAASAASAAATIRATTSTGPLALVRRNGSVKIVVPARKAFGSRSVEFGARNGPVLIRVGATQETAAAGLSLVLRLLLRSLFLLRLRGAGDGGYSSGQARYQIADVHQMLLRP